MPTLLIYNLTEEKASRIRLICLLLRIRIRTVSPAEYGETLGAVAGLAPATGRTVQETFAEEMLVFVNFDGTLLNRFLQEMRSKHLTPISLKAVLTPTNMKWDSVTLNREIKSEHEAMKNGTTAHPNKAGKTNR